MLTYARRPDASSTRNASACQPRPVDAVRTTATTDLRAPPGLSVQPENREQCSVDTPLLLGSAMSGDIPKPVDIDSTNLFDENTSPSAVDLDLGSERRWLRAARCGRNEYHRARKERIRLHDDAEAPASLLVTFSLGEAKSIDITPAHAGSP